MAWKLTVNGVDRTSEIKQAEGVDITQVASNRSTATFVCMPTLVPDQYDSIQIYAQDGVTVICGGLVLTRSVVGWSPDSDDLLTTVDLGDYNVYGDWCYSNRTYHTTPTMKQVLQDLVDDCLDYYGVSLDAGQITGPTLEKFAWKNKRASDALRDLAERCSMVFTFSPTKMLKMFVMGTDAAPFTITDAAPHCQEFSWKDSDTPTYNQVILVCGGDQSDLTDVEKTALRVPWPADWIANGIATQWTTIVAARTWGEISGDISAFLDTARSALTTAETVADAPATEDETSRNLDLAISGGKDNSGNDVVGARKRLEDTVVNPTDLTMRADLLTSLNDVEAALIAALAAHTDLITTVDTHAPGSASQAALDAAEAALTAALADPTDPALRLALIYAYSAVGDRVLVNLSSPLAITALDAAEGTLVSAEANAASQIAIDMAQSALSIQKTLLEASLAGARLGNDLTFRPNLITLGGFTGPLGLYEPGNTGSVWAFQWDPDTSTVYQRAGDAPLAVGTTIHVDYEVGFPFTVYYGEGITFIHPGTVIRKYLAEAPKIFTYLAAMETALSIHNQVNQIVREATITTLDLGWLPGQAISVNLPMRGAVATFNITSVDLHLQTDDFWECTINATEAVTYQGSFLDKWRAMTGGGSGAVSTISGTTGGGTGAVGPGTINSLAKFTGSGDTVGTSSVFDSGTLVTVNNPVLINSTLSVTGALTVASVTFTGAAVGDLFAATAVNTMGRIADVAIGQVLTSRGVNTLPAWSNAPTLTNLTLSGVLSVPSVVGDLFSATATNTMGRIAAVASGQVLASQGTGTLPAWSNAPTLTNLTLTGLIDVAGATVSGLVTSYRVATWDALGYVSASNALILGGFRPSQWALVHIYSANVLQLTIDGTTVLVGTILNITGTLASSITTTLRQSTWDSLGFDSSNYVYVGGFRASQWVGVKVYASNTLIGTFTTTGLTVVGTITATTFVGALTGNAATATKLFTARNINGVAFDGTASITVTADASTLTGTTLNATVVNSSLTSVGTLTTLRANGIGAYMAANAAAAISVGANTSGATTIRGIFLPGVIPATTTFSFLGYQDNWSTVASAFTLADLYHHYIQDVVIGSGSTVTNQWGFRIDALAHATNNYALAVAKASTQTLWLAFSGNDITAAGGIAFGSSRDTVLYRSGVGLLQTDATFVATTLSSPAATNLTIAPTGDLITNPTGKDILPSVGYDITIGSLTTKYLALHAAELWVETLVAQNTLATIGGRILVAPTTLLTANLAVGATVITTKHNNLANGDRIYMEANGQIEFMAVASGASGSGPYTYTVVRGLAWQAGYSASVLADSPVGYWRLGESSGTAAVDSAGTPHNGVYTGGFTLAVANPIFLVDTAVTLNGSTGYVSIANTAALQITGDLTIEMWINISLAARTTLISKNAANEFEFTVETNGVMNVYQGGTNAASVAGAITGGVWQHVAIVRVASTKTITFYVNGLSKGSSTYSGTPSTSTSPVLIGRASSSIQYVNGTVDEVAIYNTALSAARVATRYLQYVWSAGDAILNTGTTGNGFIDMYSVRGVKASSEIGPSIVGNVRLSTVYNDWAPRWAIGQLNGVYGYGVSAYGVAMGDPAATNITIDATNGFRIRSGTTNKLVADVSGNLSMVGDLSIGSAGVLRSVATAYGTGVGLWTDYNAGTPRFRIGDPAGNRLTWDGTDLTLVSSTVSIGTAGISIAPDSVAGFSAAHAYAFMVANGKLGVSGTDNAAIRELYIHSVYTGGAATIPSIFITAERGTTSASLALVAPGAGVTEVSLGADLVEIDGSVVITLNTPICLVSNILNVNGAPVAPNSIGVLGVKSTGTASLTGFAVAASATDSLLEIYSTGTRFRISTTWQTTGSYQGISLMTSSVERLIVHPSGGIAIGTMADPGVGAVVTSGSIVAGGLGSNVSVAVGDLMTNRGVSGIGCVWFGNTAGNHYIYFDGTKYLVSAPMTLPGLLSAGSAALTGGFGCNTKSAQTAYASGGALIIYGAGANGMDTNQHMLDLYNLVVNIRAALVANGIMS